MSNVALLWDIDGTLLHSKEKLAVDLRAAYAALGVLLSEEESYSLQWEELATAKGVLMSRFWEVFDSERQSWRDSLEAGIASFYPDSLPILKKLKERAVPMYVATRSTLSETESKLGWGNVRSHFEEVYISPLDRINFPNKKNEVLRAIGDIQKNYPAVDKIFFVGDSEVDDIGAIVEIREERGLKNILSVYIDRMNKPLKRFQADYTIKALNELESLF